MKLTRAVYVLALIKLAVQLIFVNGYGIFRDELYILANGRRLAWGFVDNAPFTPFVAWLTTLMPGDSLFALRLPAALAGSALVVLAGLLARELGGGRLAQAFAALSILCGTTWFALHHILSMNAFEPLFWMGCVYVLLRIQNTAQEKLWIWFGALAGLGLLNKYSTAFFLASLFLGLLLCRQWWVFRSKWLYAGAGVAGLLWAPNVIWQAAHGWPFVEFARNAERYKNVELHPQEFLFGQVLSMNPATLPLWLGGLVFLLVAGAMRKYRALGWSYLALLGIFLSTNAKVYYLIPIYPMLYAGGAVALEAWGAKRPRWVAPALAVAMIGMAAISAPMALPVLPPEQYLSYAKAIGHKERAAERSAQSVLPQFYADMFGWREMAAEVARIYHSLPAEDQPRACVYGQNYGEAGAMDYYRRQFGLPPAISGHNSYWIWGPGNCGEVVIVIGGNPADHRRFFEDVVEAGKTYHPYAMPYESNRVIWICRRPRAPLREIWPLTKSYI